MTPTITTPVTFRTANRRPVRGVWSFHRSDPLAVHLVLWMPGERIQSCRFSRELLGDAFLHLAGAGDVFLQVRHDLLCMDLYSSARGLFLVCGSEPVWQFLVRTREVVPQCCSAGNERLRLTPWICANPACVECRTVGPALDQWLLAAGLSAAEVEEAA